jgi:hypothetical protein
MAQGIKWIFAGIVGTIRGKLVAATPLGVSRAN